MPLIRDFMTEVREKTLPSVRVRRMLQSAHAGPSHATGLMMGKVIG